MKYDLKEAENRVENQCQMDGCGNRHPKSKESQGKSASRKDKRKFVFCKRHIGLKRAIPKKILRALRGNKHARLVVYR